MKNYLIFTAIVFLAIFLRFNNLNWDANFHLHPDERFLTMVSGDMKIPKSIGEYLDPLRSPMNPANINYKFFVYGVFPIVLNKLLAVIFNNDNYNLLTIQGRFLSGLADLFTLFFVYKIIEYLEEKYRLNRRLKYLAAFFYAISVLPIQLSHFFAIDTFLTLFMIGSFYFALRSKIILSAVFFGLAIASKISAICIFPLIAFFLFFKGLSKRKLLGRFFLLFVFIAFTYLTIRIANPYYFDSQYLLNPKISQSFYQNIKELQILSSGKVAYPPAVQWYNKQPIIFMLLNLSIFGLGIPYFIFLLIGIITVIYKKANKLYPKIEILMIVLWVLAIFFYQSIQFVKSMRYTIYLYPFISIFAAIGFEWLYPKISSRFIFYIFIIILLIWPISFSSIYFHPHSRVAASEWIYENIENGAFILSEHWDDSLPLPMENNYGKQFTGEQLPVFDPDTPEKWQKMNNLLGKADYYILSSNRGWGSIPTIPEKYPLMTKFYRDLLSGKTNYKKIKEFVSYPKLCLLFTNNCLVFSDDWSEELFTVYDHPKVIILKREK